MAQTMTEAAIEEVKSRTDLAELVASYGVSLRRSGSNWMACCPFHGEKTPSFSINPSKGFYHCFGCGESGDAIKFVMKQEGLGFADAVGKLAARCGMELEPAKVDKSAALRKRLYALTASLAQFYRRCLVKTAEAAPAREYLRKRALDEAAQEEFLIGYAPAGAAVMYKWAEKNGFTREELDAAGVVAAPRRPGDGGYHRFGGRLMFTINDRQGRAVAFSGRQLVASKNSGKYVNSPETPIFKKSQVLYCFDKAAPFIAKSPHREVICCEGQIDAIKLHLAGFRTAVASQGTAFTREHARMIKRVADAAVLIYDDDAAGRKATVKTASMLLAMDMPVRTVSLPGGDDPDSYLQKHSAQELQSLIDNAQSIVAFQCKAESEKERDARSIDAVARISKAVVRTIAHCQSPVLRATMSAEAARLLSLPAAAVSGEVEEAVPAVAKELERAESSPLRDAPPRGEGAGPEGGEAERGGGATAGAAAGGIPREEGEDAASATPPSSREMAFMAFLFSRVGDGECAAKVREHLPPDVFGHAFTREFVSAWLSGGLDGFAATLDARRRIWFDAAFLDSSKAGESTLTPGEVLDDYVRRLWCDALRRRRGALPAADPAAAAQRMALTLALKRLEQTGGAGALAEAKAFHEQQPTKEGTGQWT